MRILGVMDEDPFDHRTWSGSSAFFFNALDEAGVLGTAVSAQPSKTVERLFQLKNFHRNMEQWRFKYHIDPDLAKIRSAIAQRRASLSKPEFDAYLQVGAWYDLTGLGQPVASYHDGNLARRLDNPYGYPQINPKLINRALEWERKLYNRIDLIFTMSQWLADSFVRDFGVAEAKVCPVYAGINMPDVENYLPASYESKNILFVGKHFERKGGATLLEAFKIVRKQMKDATLTILGPQLLEVPDGVINPGFVSKSTPEGLAELVQHYRSASVFALPTLYEPFGISFVEAMAHGLPCVGTNICAVPEIIQNESTGFLVPPKNAELLAEKLLTLLENPKLSADFGRAGFMKYRQQFTWTTVADKVADQLRNIF